MTSQTPETIARRYLATWNESDAGRRREMLAALWSPDGSYVDPLASARGVAEIDGLIDAVRQRFPGLGFTLRGSVDGHGDAVRFAWQLGPDGGESLVEGTDFADLENGRLKRVTGFLDKVPATG